MNRKSLSAFIGLFAALLLTTAAAPLILFSQSNKASGKVRYPVRADYVRQK